MPAPPVAVRALAILTRPREAALLIAASLMLPLCWLALRVCGLSRMCAFVARRSARTIAPAQAHLWPWQLAIARASRHSPFPVTCLSRSFLLATVLRSSGVEAQLRIGVRCLEQALDAHAWVEVDGVPINETPDITAQFAVFDQPLPLGAFGRP